MIDRYALSPMKELWSEEAKFRRWLEVEIAVAQTFEEFGDAPSGTSKSIKEKASLDVDRIVETEKTTNHDVIAFIKVATEKMGDEARWFHKGLTSSDVVDTALSLALKEAGSILLRELIAFRQALFTKASESRHFPCVGRTHGVHAEPTSFGLKLLGFVAEMDRNITRLKSANLAIAEGKLSGAVGTYSMNSPEFEEIALTKIGLRPALHATQVMPRDLHAEFLNVLALIAAGVERLAIEIRHLQRTEVLEARESFAKGQRGSSAMPHKQNPILSERLTGMARVMRGFQLTAMENVALWHERDISHSSAERLIFPDATMILFYMLKKGTQLVQTLDLFPERMLENIQKSYHLVYSQRVLTKLVERGMLREKAYLLVQQSALKSWESRRDFLEILAENTEVLEFIKKPEFPDLFDVNLYLQHVDEIFGRFQDIKSEKTA